MREISEASYKSWIKEARLKEILGHFTADKQGGKSQRTTENLYKFLKLEYFYLNEEDNESFKFLDSLKIKCFIILISRDKEERKINELIELILQENRENDSDSLENHESCDDKFYKNDKKMLKTFSILFSWAIIPFIYYLQEDLGGDPEFDKFFDFSTTNWEIFFDFSRYMCKNYVFVVSQRNSKRKYFWINSNIGAKKEYFKKKEFGALLRDSYTYVFESKSIRKKFLEFVHRHKERALTKIIPKIAEIKDFEHGQIGKKLFEFFVKKLAVKIS